METTKNFRECQEAMSRLSIVNVVKAVDYINELGQFIPCENEVLDYMNGITRPFMNVIKQCRTEKECPYCGCYLFKSDLRQYDYVCVECDENFYECEVK